MSRFFLLRNSDGLYAVIMVAYKAKIITISSSASIFGSSARGFSNEENQMMLTELFYNAI